MRSDETNLADAKRLWAVLSALAERCLSPDEFGVLMCRWAFENRFADPGILSFLECWDYYPNSCPDGPGLPRPKPYLLRASPQSRGAQHAAFHARCAEYKVGI